MALYLTEDEVDDLSYFARAGEQADLAEALATLSARESVAPAAILTAARDESKATCSAHGGRQRKPRSVGPHPCSSGNMSLRLHCENGRNGCKGGNEKSWNVMSAWRLQY
ncbi:predicted protein [Verticillium alfalfae VaMs.102]|uniref:Predicted protein n=1 Tax=Verticillium alfalfae (strain VaMs.102 / ATCC MYA-4576 / FGSC 10136) TaxID=526221 RepID=C9SRW1_VERA1|nr:predicted protein [Verticillium alfalfae VaMs.102]EEY21526.1 predicted protein [Verticillium alfalfae VaMs.102]